MAEFYNFTFYISMLINFYFAFPFIFVLACILGACQNSQWLKAPQSNKLP